MGSTPYLDVKETTVELWLKPTFNPGPGYNPCVIAKRAQGDHQRTRFSVHVWGDYSCMAVWNGRSVLRFHAAGGPLRRDQWHHVAVTCDGRKVETYPLPYSRERTEVNRYFPKGRFQRAQFTFSGGPGDKIYSWRLKP